MGAGRNSNVRMNLMRKFAENNPVPSFEDFDLHPDLFEGLAKLGIHFPTPVQRASLPRALTDTSVAVQSFTGSGKTAIFLLPILSRALDEAEAKRPEGPLVRHLIISPSRELCMQIVRTAEVLLGDENKWMVQQLIGGANEVRQRKALKDKKPIIVVGTPGRVNAMLRGFLGLHYVETVALDEADRLFEDGFREDMGNILYHAGKRIDDGPQYLLTSASLTPSSLRKMSDAWNLPRMCEIYAKAPKVKEESKDKMAASISPTIEHFFVSSNPKHKVDDLRKTINALKSEKVLVFMNHAHRLKDTLFRLNGRNVNAGILHSEMPKTARQNAVRRFEQGDLRVLVVTDVVARGIDLACDTVVNLEIPDNPAVYAHRAGRTGRMGEEGVVVSLVAPYEEDAFRKLQKRVGLNIEEKRPLNGELKEPGTFRRRRLPQDSH
eukprot:CAMPEP_0167750584 /NCGR_PEP_ID=MMETSP0110_2-20121227/6076_1 /TAXON_ID=629695 /ORGANISM="Gymnochlora sp., Strain CCMP2014" /LENGTH=435 /DNA_ID=CAMNT_0007635929 /DNA_START=128 /DNA_END=1435 /DNA_ORIENTATION=-